MSKTHKDVYSLFELASDDTRPMTERETEMLATLTMTTIAKGQKPLPASELFEALRPAGHDIPFSIRVLIKRLLLAEPELRYDPNLVVFCAAISPNAASVVSWAYSLVREARKNREDGVGLMHFGLALPYGIPTKEAYSFVWDAQKDPKSHMSNWFDTMEAWKP